MKKLLITTMAAASLAFCAKADFAENGTSFEDNNLEAGASFLEKGVTSDASGNPVETGRYVSKDGWSTEASTDDGLFTITNVSGVTFPSRPIMWGEVPNTKALAIDTSSPLKRDAKPDGDAQDVTNPIFFDSVVQFTATDVAPDMENNTTDKLVVWLYSSPEDVATTPGLFGETSPIRRVAVTAGYLDGATLKTKNYITDIDVEPDTWHRLTIKSFKNDIGDLLFNIWVDGTQASGKETFDGQTTTTDFLSRISDAVDSDTYNKLKAVAFNGKGAVDDIVFTTDDPFYVAPDDPKEFSLNLVLSADEASEATIVTVKVNGEGVSKADGVYKLSLDASNVNAYVECATGYKIEGASYDSDLGCWIVPINVSDATENETLNVTITVVEAGGGSGEEPTTPTVEPGKPVECDSEEAAKKVTITVTDADAAAAGQAAVIKAVVKQNGNKWVVTAEIDTEATGYIPADTTLVEVAKKLTEIANATEDQDGNVTVALKDVTPGLYYSVDVSENLAEANQGFNPGTRTLATSAGQVTLKVSKPKGNSAFFKVVQHLTKE